MSELVVVRVPLRVSFLGGGSDLPLFYENQRKAGCVLSCTVNKYVYIVAKRRGDGKIVASYQHRENVDSLEQLDNAYIRETLRWMQWNAGIEVHSLADVSLVSTGLGGSSAFLVGLLLALKTLRSEIVYPARYSREELAEEAFKIETGPLGHQIGRQDHYAVALGGMNCIDFVPSSFKYAGPVLVTPIPFPAGLENKLLLLFTGMSSGGQEIFTDYHERKDCVLPIFNHLAELARKGADYAKKGLWDKTFSLLFEAWLLKRGSSSLISNGPIDQMHDEVIKAGAQCGKVCGAGSGGLMLFYCPNGKEPVLERLQGKYQDLPFQIVPNGAEIITEI